MFVMRGYDKNGTDKSSLYGAIRGPLSLANMGENPLSDAASIKRIKCPEGHSFSPTT